MNPSTSKSIHLDDGIPPQDLLLSLDLSDLAYLSEFALKNSNRYVPQEHGKLIAYLYGNDNQKCSANVQGLLILRNNTVYVAIRGSASGSDDWSDSKSKLVTLGGAHGKACVHEGFLHQYKSIQKQILAQLFQLKFETAVFCGHSVGGAVAVIAAAYYLSTPQRHTKRVRIHTFGSPRVGNKAFSDFFNDIHNLEYWSVLNDGDPIPNVPHHPKYTHVARSDTLRLSQASSTRGHGDHGTNDDGTATLDAANHSLSQFYAPRLEKDLKSNRPSAQQTCAVDCVIM